MSATDFSANAAFAGSSALIVSMIGVEPQTIVWALVGSILGVAFAKPTSKFYSVVLFLAATLTCSLLATYVATAYFDGSQMARNMSAVVLAAAFHPIFEAFIKAVPSIVDAVRARITSVIGGAK